MRFNTLSGGTKGVRNARRFLVNWQTNSASLFQFEVKQFLHHYWKHDAVYEEFPIVGTRLSFDFYNASKKIAVEVQGIQHTKFVKYFHTNRLNFLDQLKRDKLKEEFAELNGITLVTIYPDDKLNPELFATFGVVLV